MSNEWKYEKKMFIWKAEEGYVWVQLWVILFLYSYSSRLFAEKENTLLVYNIDDLSLWILKHYAYVLLLSWLILHYKRLNKKEEKENEKSKKPKTWLWS